MVLCITLNVNKKIKYKISIFSETYTNMRNVIEFMMRVDGSPSRVSAELIASRHTFCSENEKRKYHFTLSKHSRH